MVEEPVSVDDGFDPNSPLVYNFGHKSPGFNLPLMNLYVTQMADTIRYFFLAIIRTRNQELRSCSRIRDVALWDLF